MRRGWGWRLDERPEPADRQQPRRGNRQLRQQFIEPSNISLSHDGYEQWLRERARRLADVGNEFLAELAPPEPAAPRLATLPERAHRRQTA
jgi:hypothetical protein